MRVEMLGEDGRLLYREVFIFGSDGAQTNLFADMEYEIGGVAETARIQGSVDDRYGRMMALSSVEVILLAVGSQDINPSGDLLEKIVIEEPAPKALIQGGNLIVAGSARTATDKPLLIELIDTDGVVSTRRETMEYIRRSAELGVPDLYFLTGTGDVCFSEADYATIREAWARYAASLDAATGSC